MKAIWNERLLSQKNNASISYFKEKKSLRLKKRTKNIPLGGNSNLKITRVRNLDKVVSSMKFRRANHKGRPIIFFCQIRLHKAEGFLATEQEWGLSTFFVKKQLTIWTTLLNKIGVKFMNHDNQSKLISLAIKTTQGRLSISWWLRMNMNVYFFMHF